ncbi:carbohydrate ABC transporter permease [Marinomonas mediterranea]|jgi:ABC-type sugar transport systems, permease components|uniref:ABC-type transporter, integral membrane subunit n=1 Tax=Marinomonas mediterranea (strain ATCC 700492 / JCM 21426 / NBRC 103028 / MMB-1) TaxID=717774 RepID=F2K0J2_MARM1|nr:sugar ABC transporter permease [Marinomonas mediterranea]ADZ90976.1 ABC-type transporter, integral membrane subunit [Marinomonas mediterranea MMB-1]WCN09016.1 ABC transporter permease subunit [Marinomonas mediterranea]WCN13050.1 ABC transporter permease subunit [Marinomonas mediterranea]WCN17119.1 ABC transporter permease subunit [Marinomonas mediterranea MMB-1]
MSSLLKKSESQLGLKLVAPAVGIIALLVIYPIAFNVYLSFFDVQLNGNRTFVGLDNYTNLLSNPRYYHSVGISIVYLIGTVIGTTILGLAAAILMNQDFRFRNLARGLILLPYFAPVISVVFGWQFIFDPVNGIYNHMVVDVLGLTDTRDNLIGNPDSALFVVIVFDIWKHFPIAYLLFLAKLQSVPKDLYEAAAIDGQNAWGRFWHVTLPELRFVIATVVLLRVIWNLNRFEDVYLLAPNVETLPIFTYYQAFAGLVDQGIAAAISVIQLLVLVGLIWLYVRKVLKW